MNVEHAAAGSERADWPLTERDSFHVNVTGLALWRRTPLVAAGGLMMEAGNVLFHAGMAVRERRYNPGVVTATVLMVPHAAAGARWLARSGRVSRRQGLLASAAGGAFAGVPLAMKIRMRRASRLSPDG